MEKSRHIDTKDRFLKAAVFTTLVLVGVGFAFYMGFSDYENRIRTNGEKGFMITDEPEIKQPPAIETTTDKYNEDKEEDNEIIKETDSSVIVYADSIDRALAINDMPPEKLGSVGISGVKKTMQKAGAKAAPVKEKTPVLMEEITPRKIVATVKSDDEKKNDDKEMTGDVAEAAMPADAGFEYIPKKTPRVPDKTFFLHLKYTVQVGAYQDLENAENIRTMMKKKGYDVEMSQYADTNGVLWYALHIGAFNSFSLAEKLAVKFRKESLSKAFIRPITQYLNPSHES